MILNLEIIIMKRIQTFWRYDYEREIEGMINCELNPFSSTGCDWCAAGGYHGNGQCNSENHTSLFLREVATLQREVT